MTLNRSPINKQHYATELLQSHNIEEDVFPVLQQFMKCNLPPKRVASGNKNMLNVEVFSKIQLIYL